MHNSSNPPLAPFLRLITAIEVIVLLVAGGSLFFLPELARAWWPWEIPPFNTRFLGAVYLSSMVMVAAMLLVNRWAPARLALPMIFVFTLIVLVVSLLYLPLFRPGLALWLWFLLYIVLPLNSAFFLWFYRRQPPAQPGPVPAAWRLYLLGQAVVLGLYGLGLLLAPGPFGAFWPWPLDAFHGQTYSAIFVTGAVGSWLLARAAAPVEYLAVGLTQLVLGLFAILGLVLVDLAVHRVNWSQPGTWLWLGAFAVLAAAGLALIWQSRSPAA